MDKNYMKQLVKVGFEQWQNEPENEIIWEENTKKIFVELSKDIKDTIEYINSCNKEELSYISQVFEELSEHFKSQKLIDCVERNVTRFSDVKLQEQLKMELEYMKMYL